MNAIWEFGAGNVDNDNRQQGAGLISGGRAAQGIYEESLSCMFPLGTPRRVGERLFKYTEFKAAVAASVLVGPDLSYASVVEIDNSVTAAAIGAVEVVIDNAALSGVVADQYAGAMLHTTDDAGEAYSYRIASNSAASTNAVTFQLFDPLVVAVTAATDVAISGGESRHMIIASATDYWVTGVSMRAMTAGYFGWRQVGGVATVLADASTAIAAGSTLTLSDGVSGAVQTQDAYTEMLIGTALFAPDDTGHVGVKLNLG